MIKFLILICANLIPTSIYSQAIEPSTTLEEKNLSNLNIVKKFESDLVPIPVIYYTPETGVAFGATLIYTYRQQGQYRDTQKSSVLPAIVYTQNKQTLAILRSQHDYGQGEWRQKFFGIYSLYPNKFFGLGSETKEKDEELYDATISQITYGIGKKIGKSFFFGPKLFWKKAQVIEIEDGGLLDSDAFEGLDGGKEIGAGLFLNYDSSDDTFSPSKGLRSEISYLNFDSDLDSQYSYSSTDFFIRYYLPREDKRVWAFALTAKEQVGDVTFYSLNRLGGQRLMRGIFQGRYRERALLAGQMEWREYVNPIFSYVVFYSTGTVAESVRKLETDKILHTFGAGARFTVNKKANTVIRIDSGLTSEGYGGTYFGFGQAF